MIYKIYYEGDRKFALPIKNREQLMKLRNAKANLRNLEKVRQGDEKECVRATKRRSMTCCNWRTI